MLTIWFVALVAIQHGFAAHTYYRQLLSNIWLCFYFDTVFETFEYRLPIRCVCESIGLNSIQWGSQSIYTVNDPSWWGLVRAQGGGSCEYLYTIVDVHRSASIERVSYTVILSRWNTRVRKYTCFTSESKYELATQNGLAAHTYCRQLWSNIRFVIVHWSWCAAFSTYLLLTIVIKHPLCDRTLILMCTLLNSINFRFPIRCVRADWSQSDQVNHTIHMHYHLWCMTATAASER